MSDIIQAPVAELADVPVLNIGVHYGRVGLNPTRGIIIDERINYENESSELYHMWNRTKVVVV